MAESLSENVIPEDYDYKTPDHLIIWLDDYIGDPEKYHHLKRSFSSNIDPRSQTWTMLTDRDYQNLLRANEAQPVSFGGVLCLLLTFTDPNACYTAFEKYKDKRILFITSGTLGERIVPLIIENFTGIFTDPITNDPYNTIYIFCGYMPCHVDWAMPYIEYILMFDHEADLLARMTSDMAKFYFTKAGRLHADGNHENALRLYGWSKKLYLQHEKMEGSCKRNINEIDETTKMIEDTLRLRRVASDHDAQNSDDDVKGSETCT
ncbi:unnamed protein product [Rotaria sordida]|uniref:Uncharacterized protein n=1 Tax=Rotaria sordida TaxID=392033 RepID=A0A814VDG4_9BILA|nr:unnamed protein product [Rotaria sordida]CAF0941582.1 unnamed protein product [Rotaria sordida]CAF1185457.1 unnamed protein product [Rotaria sordida]CAF1247161.1 unnamed protein product [Rotaria sordida]CAF3611478.1 unnamed protein product [Rotaria sordida]